MDDREDLSLIPAPNAMRPLLGLTVLVVEDSRFACEAMRLLCLRSGARIRRADCLRSARRHLQVYRPSVVVVDIGLPDGSGAELIQDLAAAVPRIAVILGSSGESAAEDIVIAAGADGFLLKPISSLSHFQQTVLAALPPERRPSGPRRVDVDAIEPDIIAYQDDMALAAEMLGGGADAHTLDYVAQFLSGVARSAEDHPLYEAAKALKMRRAAGHAGLHQATVIAGLVQARLDRPVAI